MPSTTRAFDKLERDFFRTWVRRDPMRAVDAGLTSPYDARVPDGSAEHIEEDIRILKRFRGQLERLSVPQMPLQRQIDAALMDRMISHLLMELDTVRMWEVVPAAPRLVGECIYQLLGKNYAPLKVRMRRIMSRLALLPRTIEQTKSQLKRPVKILLENELETITRIPSFLHNLKEIGRLNLQITPMNALAKLVHELQNAVEQYYNWLIIDVLSDSPEDFSMPRAKYAGLMKVRGIPLSPDAMLQRTTSELERLKNRLKELGRRMKRRIPIEDLRDRLKANHPSDFDGVLKFVREEVNRTREFVVQTDFAKLPAREGLYVVEMPTYLRHMYPLSLTGTPARLDGKIEGYFMVSPGDCDSNRLKEFSYAAMTGMTIREGYPGRHLHQTFSENHTSLIRRLYRAPETVQGWLHYGEERIREMGYDETPQGQFIFTLEQISRAVRAIIDIQLHAGRMTVETAVHLLIDEVGMDRIVAEAEIRRILITPTESLTPIWGRDQIKELRREVRARLKGHFTDRAFHDAILGSAALPIPLLRRHLTETLQAPPPPPPAKKKEKKVPEKAKEKARTKSKRRARSPRRRGK